ncbi:hypothetical protein BLNAU_1981 [Blattamonas nauphoetae]|uniref:Uncharacterized protein n=1 Tax=Blattamonas nauphoetae TaxID=2049346 RepID=A0ABQ9YGS8_9EUKA|nr:hypothetical protein BLNAU_1981 [Blattamonas nauphoetae]
MPSKISGAKFQAGTLESEAELEFEKSYDIESVSGQSEVFLNAGVGFTVPAAGIVASTSTELNAATNEHFKVIVSGKNFESGSKWILKLTGRTEAILVTMSTSTTGESSWVKAGGSTEIAFNSAYSILSIANLSNTSDILLSSGVSVKTPLASTLTNIKAQMNTTHSDEVILTLTSERIPAGSFTLLVSKTEDEQNTPISITPFTFSVSTTPIDSILSLTVIPSGLLSCGETYTVHSLSSSSQIVSHSSLTFQVPSLLRSASALLNLSDFDEVFLSLTAFGFPSSTPITLTIVEVDEDDTPTNSPFTLTGTPSAKGGSTHILQTRVETAKLQHRGRFEITQCDVTGRVTVLDGRVFYAVPARPTLTGVGFSFATTSNTPFHLILKGTDLPVGETFLVSLDGFDEEIEVTFTTTSEGSSAELALGWSDTLQFDTAYTLFSVIRTISPIFEIPSTHLVLQPIPPPNPLIVFVSDSGRSDPKLCGNRERPCSSVDIAKTIMSAYSARAVWLVLNETTVLPSPVTIESGLDLTIKQHLQPPTLLIPSTASLGKSTCLGVVLRAVRVMTRGSPFVLDPPLSSLTASFFSRPSFNFTNPAKLTSHVGTIPTRLLQLVPLHTHSIHHTTADHLTNLGYCETTTPQPTLSTPPLVHQPLLRAHCQLSRCLHDQDLQFSNNLSDPHKNTRTKENRENDRNRANHENTKYTTTLHTPISVPAPPHHVPIRRHQY